MGEVSSHKDLTRDTPLSVASDVQKASLKGKKQIRLSRSELSLKAGVPLRFIDELEGGGFFVFSDSAQQCETLRECDDPGSGEKYQQTDCGRKGVCGGFAVLSLFIQRAVG